MIGFNAIKINSWCYEIHNKLWSIYKILLGRPCSCLIVRLKSPWRSVSFQNEYQKKNNIYELKLLKVMRFMWLKTLPWAYFQHWTRPTILVSYETLQRWLVDFVPNLQTHNDGSDALIKPRTFTKNWFWAHYSNK